MEHNDPPRPSSRLGKNESIDDWYARQEARRSGTTGKGHGRSKGLSRSGSLKRTRLNKVSKKQKKKNQETAKAYKEHYTKEENRCCHFCGRVDGLSVHHIAKRSGGNHDKQLITLCLVGDYLDQLYPELNHSHQGGCHNFIEANKSWAREQGYLV